jgi:hypothetical protein
VNRGINVGAHILAVSFGPTAHTPEWRDDRPSQLGQRILEGPGPASSESASERLGTRMFPIAPLVRDWQAEERVFAKHSNPSKGKDAKWQRTKEK